MVRYRYGSMEEKLEKTYEFLEVTAEPEVDEYAKNKLKNKIYEWKNADIEYLADLEYFVNGKSYDELLKAFVEVEGVEKFKVRFLKPNTDGEWHFSKPTKELKEKGGRGICETFDYDPTSLNKWAQAKHSKTEKVMVRAFITDFFVPTSIQTKSEYHRAEEIPRQYDPHLKKLKELWSDIRSGVLPFGIRFCLYTKSDRYSLLIDPILDKMKPHPLSGLTRIEQKDRDPVHYMIFDRVLAWMEFPDLTKKIMELLFENGKTALPDVAAGLNMEQNVAENNLKSLKAEGFVKREKEVHYKINMDKVESVADKLKKG